MKKETNMNFSHHLKIFLRDLTALLLPVALALVVVFFVLGDSISGDADKKAQYGLLVIAVLALIIIPIFIKVFKPQKAHRQMRLKQLRKEETYPLNEQTTNYMNSIRVGTTSFTFLLAIHIIARMDFVQGMLFSFNTKLFVFIELSLLFLIITDFIKTKKLWKELKQDPEYKDLKFFS